MATPKELDSIETSFIYKNSPFVPYQTDTTDGTVIYERWFSGTGFGFIRKTTIVGSVITREYTEKGKWANRTTTVYYPLYGDQ
jgi:hypothetical protein